MKDRLLMPLCVQPVERMPHADVVLTHKLMIEGNEQEYLRGADPSYGPRNHQRSGDLTGGTPSEKEE
ncbi:MAG: hypothetical protein M3Q29_18355 [Chloroflexota bacterium]|nr:hypothetical protein [Chloroflexota bacterium]